MTEPDQDLPAEGQVPDAPGGDPAASPPGPEAAEDESADPAEDEPDHESGEDEERIQTATVINQFYGEVSANSIGVSGGSGQFAKPAIRRESGALAIAEVNRALRYYLQPAPFAQALKIFADRHLVALAGQEGCGRKAGTLELARLTFPVAQSFTVLPPSRPLSELSSYKGYKPGQAYLLHDWVPVSVDSKAVASYDLEQLVARLCKANAYLAITFENADHLRLIMGEMYVPWAPPEPATLFDHCADRIEGLRLSDSERGQLRSKAAEIRSPRLVVRLAESAVNGVTAALGEAGEFENSAVATWFDSRPARWKVWAVAALTFLSGVGEHRFERQLATLADIKSDRKGRPADGERSSEPSDDNPFPQSRWALANDASLEAFIDERDASAPVGSEHRPTFRTKQHRLHFMMELNRRFGEELWTPVRDWLFTLADEPFGEAQIATGYGLALLARCALQEVETSYLAVWSGGNLKNRLMAVNVLWSMAEDDLVAPAALRIAVSWVHNKGQERAITAAIAFGGPLGQRYPSEAMRWLWVLTQRSIRISEVARTAVRQLFAMEADSDLEKSAVLRFLLQKVRATRKANVTSRERRASLAVVNSVLGTAQSRAEVPAVVGVLRTRPADFQPIGELWAAVLNSVPHRQEAVNSLYRTLSALADGTDSLEVAARLGHAILPRLTPRTLSVLQRTLPDPKRAERISANVAAAFLGIQRQVTGAIQ